MFLEIKKKKKLFCKYHNFSNEITLEKEKNVMPL